MDKSIRLFTYSAGALLLVAAMARFLVAAHPTAYPPFTDPFLGIPAWIVVLLVGVMELAVASLCLFTKRLELQLTLLAWLALNFFAYGYCLMFTHYNLPSSGIGSLTDPLGLSHGVAGMLAKGVPYYLLAGSLAGLVWCAFEPRRVKVAARLKMFCPLCGIHIEFDVKNLGRKIDCPGCKTTIVLRKPEFHKITCAFCHEHIEFPSYALGRHIQCPHCSMGITLKEQA
jgi:DNA-directed RNA polymerase subunit RPC12/RpoP